MLPHSSNLLLAYPLEGEGAGSLTPSEIAG